MLVKSGKRANRRDSTINSIASSPDRRRLTYSYSASSGDISGNNATATLATQGAQPGAITVTCNVSDDRNPPLTASSTTSVTVEAPPAPAPEIAQLEVKLALHSIYFPTARPTVENPDGGLVESQAKDPGNSGPGLHEVSDLQAGRSPDSRWPRGSTRLGGIQQGPDGAPRGPYEEFLG